MLSNFEKYAEEGNWFINKVAREIGHPGDPALAFRITRAVLRALRDRITIEESYAFDLRNAHDIESGLCGWVEYCKGAGKLRH
jgi:uncharacterized protein (DUF2267 family)